MVRSFYRKVFEFSVGNKIELRMVCKNSEMLKEAERERARIEEDKRKEQVTCIDYHILKSLVHFLSKFNLNLTCKKSSFRFCRLWRSWKNARRSVERHMSWYY